MRRRFPAMIGLVVAGCLGSGPALGQAAPDRDALGADLEGLPLRGLETARAPASPPGSNVTRLSTRGATRDAVRATTAGSTRADVSLPPPSIQPPAPPPRRSRPDEDPYAPLGLRLGNVLVLPSITESLGYDDNPNRSPNGDDVRGSFVSRTDGEVLVQSDWSRHELTGSLRAGYSFFRDVDDASRPDASGRLTYRHDITSRTAATIETRLRLDTERPGSPDLNAEVRDRPVIASYGIEAGGSHRFNRLTLGLRGSVDRQDYEDAELTNGAVLDQGDRNFTEYGLRLRAGYEVSPAIQPFAEVGIDTRQRDDAIDRDGFERSSNGLTGRVGAILPLTAKLTGEISGGYQTRAYDDARLQDLRGPIGEAALTWSVSPLTQVRLALSSALGETTIVGASGTILSRAGIEVRHDLRRNLSLVGGLALARSDYRGTDLTEDTFTGSVRLDYRLNRSFVASASYLHERLSSTIDGADYDANVYLLGLRVQR